MSEGFRMTALGEIPLDWKVEAIGDIASVVRGASPRPKGDPRYYGGNVPRLMGQDVTRDGKYVTPCIDFLTEEGAAKSRFMKAGTLVMICSGDVGVPSILAVDACVHDGFLAFPKISSNCSKEFLYYIFDSLHSDFNKSATHGGVFTNLTTSIIKEFKIPLPSLEEQKGIAEILSIVDEKIQVIEGQIAQTTELKKGLMQRLLTKGIGHTQFKASPLGEIPESWEVVKLSDVSKFSNGKGHEQFIDENGKYIVVNSKFISTEGEVKKYSNRNLCPLYKGEITMVMSDIPNGKAIAKCFIVEADDKYTLNQRICSINVNTGVDARFIFYLINRNPYYLAFDNGVSQTNLKKQEVTDCPIQLPPLNEQKAIASGLITFDEKIQALVKKRDLVMGLKKGLMQQLLTGKLRVNHLIENEVFA